MKDIITILSELGITVEESKKKDVMAAVNKEYKTINEYDKKVQKLEEERNTYKSQLDTASETLKKFDGMDPDAISRQKEEYEKKIKEIQEEHQKKEETKNYEEAVDKSLSEMKFTSEYAKKAIKDEIMAAGLKVVDGKLMGLNDLVGAIKEKDSSAFIDEQQQDLENNKARFTGRLNNDSGANNAVTKEKIMSIKDRAERRKAISENMELFQNKM